MGNATSPHCLQVDVAGAVILLGQVLVGRHFQGQLAAEIDGLLLPGLLHLKAEFAFKALKMLKQLPGLIIVQLVQTLLERVFLQMIMGQKRAAQLEKGGSQLVELVFIETAAAEHGLISFLRRHVLRPEMRFELQQVKIQFKGLAVLIKKRRVQEPEELNPLVLVEGAKKS